MIYYLPFIYLFIYFYNMNSSIDSGAFFNFTISFQFLTINLLFTSVKFLLINNFVLGTPAFFINGLELFLILSACKRCFLLPTQTVRLFFPKTMICFYFIRGNMNICRFQNVSECFFNLTVAYWMRNPESSTLFLWLYYLHYSML